MLKLLKSLLRKKEKIKITTSLEFKTRELSPAEIQISELGKQATQHKKKKEFNKALQTYEESLSLHKQNNLEIHTKTYIRYAHYLQLAKNSDKGWKVLQETVSHTDDIFAQIDTYNAMRLFLQREKRSDEAITYGIIARLLEIKKWKTFDDTPETKKYSERRWEELVTLESTEYLIDSFTKKAKRPDLNQDLVSLMQVLMKKTPFIDTCQIHREVEAILNSSKD